jgi:hypothetical protein
MHPLDGPRLKISYAKAEIDRLRSVEEIFFQNTHYSVIRAEIDSVSGNQIYRVKVDGYPPSLDWGISIGEIVHNLRSALNHLVYQLAFLNSANEPKAIARDRKLQFPICIDPDEFRRRGINRIKLLCSEHKTTVERLQPYSGSSSLALKTVNLSQWSGRNSPLYWLEEINNADKHRIIQVAGPKAVGVGVGYWGKKSPIISGGTIQMLEDGAIFSSAEPNRHVDINITPFIAFADGCDAVRGQVMNPILDKIATTVAEIIDIFEPEFERGTPS